MQNYVKQLKDFQSYMNACFEVLMEHGDEDNVHEFYNTEFEISFRGKKAVIYNGAAVFQAIEEIIQTEIDESEDI